MVHTAKEAASTVLVKKEVQLTAVSCNMDKPHLQTHHQVKQMLQE